MQRSLELNHGWLLAIDPENKGKENGMAKAICPDAKPAPVPGIIQQVYTSYHGVAWYYLRITEDTLLTPASDERLVLHFGAVDYASELFIDGIRVLAHEGAEDEFEVDVTNFLKIGSLIALRVINPVSDRDIDGLVMHLTPHRNKVDGAFHPGACYNSGGIMLPVTLCLHRALRVSDCFVRADWKSGEVDLEITLSSLLEKEADAILTLACRLSEANLNQVEKTVVITANTGQTTFHLSFAISDFKLWDIDSPNIYELSLTVESETTNAAAYATHFGFRDFRLINSYFYLNGRRIFLKSAHTGNHLPEGLALPAPSMPELEFKDFQLSKAAGFNCIRFIATQATPRQLDYCDRLGLMVYQETYASWLLGNNPRAKEMYDASILAEIKRDRNHPSITIWGMLNETIVSDAHNAAIDILPRVRELDDTRLVLFSSGRFDLSHGANWYNPDSVPDTTLGSAANPESSVWENVWGVDGIPFDQITPVDNGVDGYRFYTGDYHNYPAHPHTDKTIRHMRTYAHDTKPTFISEYGVGSLLNVIDHCLEYEHRGTDPTAPDYLLMRSIADRYISDFNRLGFDRTYAMPEDLLRDSEKYNALSRTDGMDIIRANPRFVGYNMTGLLDHAICGEGPYTLFRRIKPENYDAISEGFAPLRFCLFFEIAGKQNQGCHIYSGTPLTLEAVLADEDTLADGEYTAVFAVTDENGAPYYKTERRFTSPVIGEDGLRQMAYPLMKETVSLPLAPGKYFFRAYLKNGGCPVACEKSFFVSARPEVLIDKKIAAIGLPAKVSDHLQSLGVTLTDPEEASVILVGSIDKSKGFGILALTETGKRTVFLDPDALRTENGYGEFLPLPDYRVEPEQIWLYHSEAAFQVDPFLTGMKTGFCDWRYYFGMIPTVGLTTSRTPDRCAAAHFYVGGPGEYHCSQILSVFDHGKGELVISTAPILATLTSSPTADRLLINLLTQ